MPILAKFWGGVGKVFWENKWETTPLLENRFSLVSLGSFAYPDKSLDSFTGTIKYFCCKIKTRVVLLQAGTTTEILLLVRSGHATDYIRLKPNYPTKKSAKFYLVSHKSDESNEIWWDKNLICNYNEPESVFQTEKSDKDSLTTQNWSSYICWKALFL